MSEPLFVAISASIVSLIVSLIFLSGRRRRGVASASMLPILLGLWAVALLAGWVLIMLPASLEPVALASLPASGSVLMLVRRRATMRETGRDDRYRLYMAVFGFGLAVLIVGAAVSGYFT